MSASDLSLAIIANEALNLFDKYLPSWVGRNGNESGEMKSINFTLTKSDYRKSLDEFVEDKLRTHMIDFTADLPMGSVMSSRPFEEIQSAGRKIFESSKNGIAICGEEVYRIDRDDYLVRFSFRYSVNH